MKKYLFFKNLSVALTKTVFVKCNVFVYMQNITVGKDLFTWYVTTDLVGIDPSFSYEVFFNKNILFTIFYNILFWIKRLKEMVQKYCIEKNIHIQKSTLKLQPESLPYLNVYPWLGLRKGKSMSDLVSLLFKQKITDRF